MSEGALQYVMKQTPDGHYSFHCQFPFPEHQLYSKPFSASDTSPPIHAIQQVLSQVREWQGTHSESSQQLTQNEAPHSIQ